MKAVILAAGQGTRLRPLTDYYPKCMVKINGESIIKRQIEVMHRCGIADEDIIIISGYRSNILEKEFQNSKIQFIINTKYETTNMVYSLMCARYILEKNDDILVSYGDIIYDEKTLKTILKSTENISVIVDDRWFEYWSERFENPLDDAETLMFDENDYLIEIGQKTKELSKIQSQYIGLMRFKNKGIQEILEFTKEEKRKRYEGKKLWKTEKDYSKMYMTDLLQGLIDNKSKLKAIHIQRGWYEIDDEKDLIIAEKYVK